MDFRKDTNKTQFLVIFDAFDVPEFVKKASTDEADTIQSLPSSAYAGVNTFPTHTKAATWMSCAYFLLNEQDVPKDTRPAIEDRLKSAAQDWGIDFDALRDEHVAATVEKPRYLINEKSASGEDVNLLPVSDLQSLRTGAEWLYENRDRLPFTWRQKAARALISEAGEYDGTILPKSDYLHKAAGYGTSDPKTIAGAFAVRAKLLQAEPVSKEIMKVAVDLYRTGLDKTKYASVATTLATIDEKFNLHKYYSQSLPTPEEVVFGRTFKEARELMNTLTMLPNGKLVTDEQIEQAPIMKAARVIGGGFLNAVTCSLFTPTLPLVKKAIAELKPEDADTLCLFIDAAKGNDLDNWQFLTEQ